MGLNGITYIVESNLLQQKPKRKTKINKENFDMFCKGYIFSKLAGYRFGVEFCNNFKVNDLLIYHERNCTDKIKKYILQNYVQ
jgi:hypothetical protein